MWNSWKPTPSLSLRECRGQDGNRLFEVDVESRDGDAVVVSSSASKDVALLNAFLAIDGLRREAFDLLRGQLESPPEPVCPEVQYKEIT